MSFNGHIACLCFTALLASAAGPCLVPQAVDLGEFPANQPQCVVFALAGSVQEPLSVEHVRSSCGCLTVRDCPRHLAAGESIQLSIEVKSMAIHGSFDKTFFVSLKGEVSGRRLMLQGNVRGNARHLLEVAPTRTLILGTVPRERPTSCHFTLTAREDGVELFSRNTSEDGSAVRLEKLAPRQWRVEVRITPSTDELWMNRRIHVGILKPRNWEDVVLQVQANFSGGA